MVASTLKLFKERFEFPRVKKTKYYSFSYTSNKIFFNFPRTFRQVKIWVFFPRISSRQLSGRILQPWTLILNCYSDTSHGWNCKAAWLNLMTHTFVMVNMERKEYLPILQLSTKSGICINQLKCWQLKSMKWWKKVGLIRSLVPPVLSSGAHSLCGWG